VKLADAIAFIKDQGTFVIDSLAEIGDEEATDISRMIGNLFLGLFCGIAAIVATRTSQNEASSAELPASFATLPFQGTDGSSVRVSS
jgi:hypothetical protein